MGLLGGIAILSTIGFFVLLTNGTGQSIVKSAGNIVTDTSPTPSAPTPSQPSGSAISLAPITNEDHIKGNKNAKITIVEYSDTECPFCKRFHPTMQQIVDDYNGQVNWVYRHFPLTSLHSKAPKEAEATECAAELGGNDGFWAYLDRLFAVTPANNGLDLAQLPQIAEDVGLNRSKFEACLNSGKYAQKIQDQTDQAQAAGGRGTPYSIIVSGDQTIPVSGALPLEQIKSMIEPLL